MNEQPLRVLILEDRADDVELMLYELRRAGFMVDWTCVTTEVDYLAHLNADIDIILADYALPQFDAHRALTLLQARDLNIPFIIISGSISEELTVAVIKQGADDYLLKDRLARLAPAVRQALAARQLRDERQKARLALRQSEHRYRSLFENLPVGLYRSTPAGRILDANPALVRMLGYASREALLASNARDLFVAPEDREREKALLISQGAVRGVELQLRRADGAIIWVRDAMRATRNAEGQIIYEGSMEDITERKRAEAALQHRIAMEELIAEISTDFVSLLPAEVDAGIQRALQAIGVFADVDRSYIFLFSEDLTLMSNTHEWCAPGVTPYRAELQDISVDTFPYWMASLRRSESFQIPRVADLPPEAKAEKAIFQSQNIQSLAAVPMVSGERLIGFLGFDLVREARTWSPEDITMLKVMAEAIVGALERQRTEAALRVSEERYRLLAETARDIICIHDMAGRIRYLNPAGLDFMGYSKEEMEGKYVTDLLAEEQMDAARARRARRQAGNGERYLYETEFINAAGERVSIEVSSSPIVQNGEVTSLLLVARDITARQAAEEERERLLVQVQEQAQRLQQVMASVPEGVLLLDVEGRVVLANPVAQKDLELLAGARVGEILDHLGDHALSEVLTSPPQGRWHEIQSDQRVFETIAKPLVLGPQPGGWVLVLRDVTEEREIQQRAAQQGRLAAVGQLAAGIAHDFNNIMAVIVLYAQMAGRTPNLPDSVQDKLYTITEQAHEATNLIEQILDFSRRAVLERRPLELLPLLKEQIKLFDRTFPDSITVRLAHDGKSYTVSADPTRIQQTLMNLAVNARDAMPHGGTLTFALSKTTFDDPKVTPLPEMAAGTWIRLEVRDTGVGIPPEALPHIFEPFFTTKGVGQGSGLGLAQVFGIVRQHEGYIDVVSPESGGATFTIYLPALMMTVTQQAQSEAAATLPQGRGEVVLIVEDNPAARQALVDALESLNYRTLEVMDGEAALHAIEQAPREMALVLSDIAMPRMDGLTLVQALQREAPHLPVILISGHPQERDPRQFPNLYAWLTKPVDLAQLAEILARALRES
ncbi:MAG: PAS domain S-box protein [Anaerolineales bacterium]